MFATIGHFTVRRRRLVLALTVLFVLGAGAAGSGLFGRLGDGGLTDPDAESSRAAAFLTTAGQPAPELVLLVEARAGAHAPPASGVPGRGEDDPGAGVDAPAVVAAGRALTAEVAAEPGVASAVSYWTAGGEPALRSTDGMSALVVVDVSGDPAAGRADEAAARIADAYAGDRGPLTVRVGGAHAIDTAIGEQLARDLIRAEAIAVPLTLLLLLLAFRGLVAAALPLVVAAVAIAGAMLGLAGVARLTDVSVYSINLMTGLGFGLAIDYSLFILTRFREELAAGGGHRSRRDELAGGRDVEAAVVRTVATAGRSVAFSALTVAASLSALLVFPLSFLRSFAYAGAAVVLAAAAASLLTLPALLAVLGHRVAARRTAVSGSASTAPAGRWERLARAVTRRPLPVAVGVVVVLLALGSPFLRVDPGLPSYTSLPPSSQARQVAESLDSRFAGNQAEEFAVVLPGVRDGSAVAAFAQRVGGVGGVAAVSVRETDAGSWLGVVPSVVSRSPEGERLVREIRGLGAPFGYAVGGDAAELVDAKAAIAGRLPLALAIIALTTAVLLFAAFGSVLVPVKAILLNLLSLTATFGAMVWIFQEGHLSGLLGFTATGQLDVTMPVLMFCVAFGLSMDYEVFLLSRIKEEYDRTGDNALAIATGVGRTGGLITSAALLLAISFAAFGVSGMSFLKLMGIGLALAILMDATVIRGLLVPAFMRLAGDANWWAPAPLRRLRGRPAPSGRPRPVVWSAGKIRPMGDSPGTSAAPGESMSRKS